MVISLTIDTGFAAASQSGLLRFSRFGRFALVNTAMG